MAEAADDRTVLLGDKFFLVQPAHSKPRLFISWSRGFRTDVLLCRAGFVSAASYRQERADQPLSAYCQGGVNSSTVTPQPEGVFAPSRVPWLFSEQASSVVSAPPGPTKLCWRVGCEQAAL